MMAGCGLYLSRSLRALRALRGGGAPLAPRMCPFLSPFSSVSDSAGVRGVRDDTIRDLFFSFAHPGDGDEQEPYLDASDLGHLLGALGERVTPQRVDRLLRQVDEDDSGTISLGEFLAGHEHLLQHTGDEDDLRRGGRAYRPRTPDRGVCFLTSLGPGISAWRILRGCYLQVSVFLGRMRRRS